MLLFLVLTVVATAAAVAANSDAEQREPTPRRDEHARSPSGRARRSRPCRTVDADEHAPDRAAADDHDRAAPRRARLALDRAPRRRRAPNPNALAVWPAGQSGYTDVLESLPAAAGRANALARARRRQAGRAPHGRRPRSRRSYSSLHPGYYVVFSGIYGTQAAGDAGARAAHAKGFPDAYQTRVTR